MENIELTPNRMTCNAVTDENKNVLITEFKSSPKSPAESKIEKKKLFKKKAKNALRHRKRLSSQSSERSDASQQQVVAPYNLIEFYGDRSRSGSVNPENDVSCNQSAGTDGAISSGSSNLSNLQSFTTCIGDFSTTGVSVHQARKNVIFVIPEGWASSIEIMRLSMNLLDNLSSSSAASPYEEQANSVGPVRSKGKSYRSNRNAPYYSSRRDKQSYYAGTRDSELTSSAGRSNMRNSTFSENIDFDRYYTVDGGYKYEPRDYERTSSSIGPIRRSSKRKAFYTPYGSSAARERANYNSMDSASSSSPNDSYNKTDSSPYYSGGKNYQYSDKNKCIVCWHCRRKGHIRINCPSRVTHKKY